MSDLEVRLGCVQDYPALLHFYDEVTERNAGTKYDVLWNRALHPSDEQIERSIAQGVMYVAYQDDALVAATIINDDFAAGYKNAHFEVDAAPGEALCIHLFAVHPDYAGQGIGKRFLLGCIDMLSAQGIKALRLDVFDYNEPARRLYESVGFKDFGPIQLIYTDQASKDWVFILYELAL